MINVFTVGNTFNIRCPVSIKDRVKGIVGARYNRMHQVWQLPATHCAAVQLCAEFLNPADIRGDEVFWQKFRPTRTPNYRYLTTKPWGHQIEAIEHALKHDGACLWMDMGTGKSLCGIAAACEVDPITKIGVTRIVILCPFSVIGVWEREFKRHSDGRFAVWRRDTGKGPADLDLFVATQKAKKRDWVAVINYESAVTEKYAAWLMDEGCDLLIFDEIHRIKAPGGQRSKFAARLGAKAGLRLGLTGTLLPHSPLDAYAQFRALDASVFGRSYVLFKKHYCIEDQFGQPARFINQGEMIQRIRMITYEVDKSVLDLPKMTHEYRTCRLSPAARKAYKELENEFYVQVEAGEITAANALVKLLRLQQITSGDVKSDDGSVVEIDREKEKLLLDTLEDIGPNEPVVVVCKFRTDIDRVERLAEKLGRRFGAICGDRKDGLDEHAKMRDDVELLAVQIQSGGVGIDLTRARVGIFYSLGFSLGDYEQMLARIHRPGQDRPVLWMHLLAEGTVDRNVYYALRRRRSVIDDLVARRPEMDLDLEEAA